jgi:16S rRNA (guanine(966)-N(2))-methyltransferase RsmD
MRIRAGALKGRRLVTPAGRTTRPTADQVRVACLDTLAPGLGDGPFLDVFAGAGGIGIEALSRGAPRAVFVEDDRRALRALRENLRALELEARARVAAGDAERVLPRLAADGERFAAVFLDPPYDAPAGPRALALVAALPLLLPGAVVVAQHATKAPPPPPGPPLVEWKRRRFGETTLTFFRAGA